MPRAGDAVAVHEREPAGADDLEVVAGDRLAPPRLVDPPLVADLDRLADAIPPEGDQPAGDIQLRIDERVLAQQAGHRPSALVDALALIGRPRRAPRPRRRAPTASAPPGAAPRGRPARSAGRGRCRTRSPAGPAARRAARPGRPAA